MKEVTADNSRNYINNSIIFDPNTVPYKTEKIEHEDYEIISLTTKDTPCSSHEEGTYSDNKNYEGVIPLWLSKMGQHRILTREEEKEIGKRIKEGDKEACDLMVQHNFRLVFSVALKYKELGVPLEDLVQEGSIGLMKATKRFDYTKGFKFSTYAIWWVRQTIMRLLDNMARTIRLPSHLIDKSYLLDDIHGKLQIKLNREPSLEEIATELSIETDQVIAINTLKKGTVSLNKELKPNDVTINLIDTVEDPYTNPNQTYISDLINKDLVGNLLSKLSVKQREILRRRYGIDKEGNIETLKELGDTFNLTRERIRQIEVDSLKKLRDVYDEYGESRFITNT